jgi:hypothetical protein
VRYAAFEYDPIMHGVRWENSLVWECKRPEGVRMARALNAVLLWDAKASAREATVHFEVGPDLVGKRYVVELHFDAAGIRSGVVLSDRAALEPARQIKRAVASNKEARRKAGK